MNVHEHDFTKLMYLAFLCKEGEDDILVFWDTETEAVTNTFILDFEPALIKLFMKKVADTESEIIVLTIDNISPDTEKYKSNMIEIYKFPVENGKIGDVEREFYNYISLLIEGLYAMDFEYYAEYELLIVADR